jgi:hypothetical protein
MQIHDRPPHIRAEAVALLRAGMTNPAVAAKLGVPAGTIGYWKHLDVKRNPSLYPQPRAVNCPFCGDAELDEKPYAYLLGLYLGDGHIVHNKKQYSIAITCADAWPGLKDEAEDAIHRVMPGHSVRRRQRTGCAEIKCNSKHWICLFPQHGPGKKHTRRILLYDWQREIVDDYPELLLRGLIHSDGCRSVNRIKRRGAQTGYYEYPRYLFKNESAHIRDLYTETLTDLDIEWRYNKYNEISVAKRASVELMDTFIGPKY